jgi:hypothetical protein
VNPVEKALYEARNEPFAAEDTDDNFLKAVLAVRDAVNGQKLRDAAKGASSELILRLLAETPLTRNERVTLAELLAGVLNRAGTPMEKAEDAEAYRRLVVDANAKFRHMRAAGVETYEARVLAAEWAANQPAAKDKSASTIERDMQDAHFRG